MKKKSPSRPPTVAAAIRAVVAGWSGSFHTDTLAEQIIQRWPGLARKVKTGLSTSVAFLIEKGELASKGREGCRHALQRTAHLRAPAAQGEANAAGHALLAEIHAEEAARQPQAEG